MAVNITPFIPYAQRIERETGLPSSIILGQIMLESGGRYDGGLSGLAVQGKNLFGIKGTGPAGSIYLPTREVVNGQYVTVQGKFRKYNDYYESMVDHARLLSTERYKQHLVNAKTVEDFAQGIKNGGYATDPSYVSKLINTIKTNELNRFDSGNYTFSGTVPGMQPTLVMPFVPGMAEENRGIYFHVVRTFLLFFFLVIAIVFFAMAFPQVSPQSVAEKVTPIGRGVGKIRKAASKISKKGGGKNVGKK